MEKLILETGLSDKDMKMLRETFVEKYANEQGWDKTKLTTEQLNEIYQQNGYKRPGLLLS